MKRGMPVVVVHPRTRQEVRGVLDHVATMRSSFVAAFVKVEGSERLITVAVTKVKAVG